MTPFSTASSKGFWRFVSQTPESPEVKKIGDFQYIVLFSVKSLGENSYGLKIQEYFSNELKRDVHLPQIYSALVKLEQNGFLSSKIDNVASAGRRGRPRRIYSVSAPGLRLLRMNEGLSKTVHHSGDPYGIAGKASTA